MTYYGYMRVSTEDQTHDLQRDALLRSGITDGNIFSDTITGKSKSRPGLDKLLLILEKGDSLTVWKLDRLGRSVINLYTVLSRLNEAGATFRSLQETFDTATPMGKAMFGMLSIFAEFEIDQIKERTRAGLAARRAAGVRLGRPSTYDRGEVIRRLKALESIGNIASSTTASRSTVARISAGMER